MLTGDTKDKSAPRVDAAQDRPATAASAPLLVSIREARRQLGDIGPTAFYAAVKRHKINLVRLGGRSLVPMSAIENVVAKLIAERPANTSDKAKVLAAMSVAARQHRQGGATSTTAASPPMTKPRRRRGSSAA
jgi:hypothetical protein